MILEVRVPPSSKAMIPRVLRLARHLKLTYISSIIKWLRSRPSAGRFLLSQHVGAVVLDATRCEARLLDTILDTPQDLRIEGVVGSGHPILHSLLEITDGGEPGILVVDNCLTDDERMVA
jgi:hypothetical protein